LLLLQEIFIPPVSSACKAQFTKGGDGGITNQSIIVWTLKTKSLLPPSFDRLRMVSMPNHFPKGGAAVQSRITHFKPGIGTLAPDGITPLWKRGVRGDFQKNMSNQLWTP